jgi:hypothetical protein
MNTSERRVLRVFRLLPKACVMALPTGLQVVP